MPISHIFQLRIHSARPSFALIITDNIILDHVYCYFGMMQKYPIDNYAVWELFNSKFTISKNSVWLKSLS